MPRRGFRTSVFAIVAVHMLGAGAPAAVDLAEVTAQARRGAEVRLYWCGPEFFAAIEAASQRQDLAPQQAAKIKEIIQRVRPWIAARAHADQQVEAAAQWNQSTALTAYDAAGKKDPKWAHQARVENRLKTRVTGNANRRRGRQVRFTSFG